MKFVPNGVTRTIARKALTFKKQSPHIFFGAGIAGFVGTTVLACRATLKLSDTMDTFHEDVEAVKQLGQDSKDGTNGDYDETQYTRDLAYVYGKGTIAIAKLYAPAVGVGIFSVGALTGSHVALARRNTALTAALVAVGEAYESYRRRVADVIGDEEERDLYLDIHDEKVKDEDGKLVTQTLGDPSKYSVYARIFDEYSEHWERNWEYNRMFLDAQQTWANNRLHAKGHVFLNEVYDALGLVHSSAGSVVGWVRDGDGDGYVDFGMFQIDNRDFINGPEKSVLLDFNVDGVIYDKI